METNVANAKEINWSELTRENLYSYFNSLGKDVVGQSLTADQIQKKISKHIKKSIPIRIAKAVDPSIKQTFIYIGGWYYSGRDKEGKSAITIEFSYHPFDEKYKITPYRWRRMALTFSDVLLHEIVHMRQFRARNFKSIPGYQSTAERAKDRKNQEYYGDRDEMGAYAFNIACEMIDRFSYDPKLIKEYLDSDNARRHKNSSWFRYLKAFNFDHNHAIIRRMKKKVLHQLDNAYYGKPFKTPDWLTY